MIVSSSHEMPPDRGHSVGRIVVENKQGIELVPLTALKVTRAGPGRHSDMHGLYLLVRESGSRSWILRYQHRGKRRDYGLGPVHDVSLAEARCRAMEIRKLVRAGKDPAKGRPLVRKRVPNFEDVTQQCYQALRTGWKDRRNASWLSSFENHVFSIMGAMRIDEVDSQAVLSVLEPIWLSKPDTARRVFQRIGAVLDYAHIKGMIAEPISLRSVRKGLPRQTRQVTHRAAMPYAEVPAFMAKLMELPPTVGRDALKLTILTAVRSNETRFATWGEFDLDNAIWTIPPSRMKMKEQHVVPLGTAAMELLTRLHGEQKVFDENIRPESLLFSAYGCRPIADMTMLKVLRDLNVESATVHGFRSAFTDWAADNTRYQKEVVDKALAHRIPNVVEAAYRRTAFFSKRLELMKSWGDFISSSSKTST